MKPHLLIAVDAFGDAQIEAFAQAVDGWATCERMPEFASAVEYIDKLAAADMMVGWPEPEWLLESPIKLLLCPSVGYDEYLIPQLAAQEEFTLCNSSNVYSDGIAEHCLSMMMALTRRLPQYLRQMQSRIWYQVPGHDELGGANACVIGLGGIGTAIARRCAAMGMTVTGVRRDISKTSDVVTHVYAPDQLHEAVAAANHVISAVPGGPTTNGMFNSKVFDAMKAGAYFYNVGRGSVVDEEALIRRLQNGKLAGAGLDVFADEPLASDSPLWSLENAILTPHVAGFTADYAKPLSAMMISNLHRYHKGEPLLNAIDIAGAVA